MAASWELTVGADLDNLGQVRDFLAGIAAELSIGPETLGELQLAVDEAVTNIITHGFAEAGLKAGMIEVSVEQNADALSVRLRDDALPYDPLRTLAPDLATSPLARAQPGGYGIYLITHLSDQVSYQHTEDGKNELTLVKRFTSESARPGEENSNTSSAPTASPPSSTR